MVRALCVYVFITFLLFTITPIFFTTFLGLRWKFNSMAYYVPNFLKQDKVRILLIKSLLVSVFWDMRVFWHFMRNFEFVDLQFLALVSYGFVFLFFFKRMVSVWIMWKSFSRLSHNSVGVWYQCWKRFSVCVKMLVAGGAGRSLSVWSSAIGTVLCSVESFGGPGFW